MAVDTELRNFVRDGLGGGASREELERVLTGAGWDRAQVRAALAGYADMDFGMPVPRPRPNADARHAFLHLLVFFSLLAVTISAGNVGFLGIDRLVADPGANLTARQVEVAARNLRWAGAWLIVSTPIFIWVSALVGRIRRRDVAREGSRIHRWLTYLTLFGAAVALTGDAVSMVNAVLGGEVALRFALKSATVAIIAGSVFGYYLYDLRREEPERDRH